MKDISVPKITGIDKALPGEPTELDRIEQNAKLTSQLRGLGSDEADLLAVELDSCRPRARCLNAACQVCGTAAQRQFMTMAGTTWAADVPLVHITIVPGDLRREIGSLATVDFKEIIEHLRELLSKAGFSRLRALAFIDLNHSVDLRVMREFWQPHFHMVAAAGDTQYLTAKFRTVLPSTPSVPRPVVSVKLNDPSTQLHYISKPRPIRVTRFRETSSPVRPLKQWLKMREHIEAMLWLGQYCAMDRIVVLHGSGRRSNVDANARS
jgi:hypothetical protein